jgi:hypothetical protein
LKVGPIVEGDNEENRLDHTSHAMEVRAVFDWARFVWPLHLLDGPCGLVQTSYMSPLPKQRAGSQRLVVKTPLLMLQAGRYGRVRRKMPSVDLEKDC